MQIKPDKSMKTKTLTVFVVFMLKTIFLLQHFELNELMGITMSKCFSFTYL